MLVIRVLVTASTTRRPVERLAKFELMISVMAAHALGFMMPESISPQGGECIR